MVHEATGLTFKPGNPESLATAMIRLMEDRVLGDRVRHDAQEFVGDRFGWDRIARGTMDVYRRAMREYEYRPRALRVCPPLPMEAGAES